MKPLKNQPRYMPHTRGGYHETSTVVMRGVRWSVLKNVGFTQIDIYDEKKEFCHICINYKVIDDKYQLYYAYVDFYARSFPHKSAWVDLYASDGYRPVDSWYISRRDFFALCCGLVAFMRADKF